MHIADSIGAKINGISFRIKIKNSGGSNTERIIPLINVDLGFGSF